MELITISKLTVSDLDDNKLVIKGNLEILLINSIRPYTWFAMLQNNCTFDKARLDNTM